MFLRVRCHVHFAATYADIWAALQFDDTIVVALSITLTYAGRLCQQSRAKNTVMNGRSCLRPGLKELHFGSTRDHGRATIFQLISMA